MGLNIPKHITEHEVILGKIPAGSDKQIQYNDNGKLAGSEIEYNKSDKSTTFANGHVYLKAGKRLYFDG